MLKIEIFSNIKREGIWQMQTPGRHATDNIKLFRTLVEIVPANATVIAIAFFSCYHYLRVSLIHVSNHFCFKQADSSLSQYLSPVIKKKIRAQENPKEKKKNVFTKQTSRDGLDEAVSNHLSIFFNYIHFPWLKASSDFSFSFFFSLVGFV